MQSLPKVQHAYCKIALSIWIAYGSLYAHPAEAQTPAEFDSGFLFLSPGETASVDISSLASKDNHLLAGNYLMDITLNGQIVDRQKITFAEDKNNKKITPCFNRERLELWGVKLTEDIPAPEKCLLIKEMVAQASYTIDTQRMRMNLIIPQAFIRQNARGYISPELWDEGINAGFINYQFTGRKSYYHNSKSIKTGFLGLQNGFNLGAWHLRNESNFNFYDGQKPSYKSNRTFVQRDIAPLNGQLYLGDIYSDSMLFDSIKLRGLALRTDESMLPDSSRGFAPVIHGNANSNATVEVRQNGYLLYSTNVPPGPFTIDNLYPSGSNGDLATTVIESDGSRHTTVQAFSSLPLMIRKDQIKYAIETGRFRPDFSTTNDLNVITASALYGMFDNYSLASGFQITQGFSAVNIGIGANTIAGAFSADMTQSSSKARGQNNTGRSVRVLYSKMLDATFTTFTLAAYRYSTQGYRTLSDHTKIYSNDYIYKNDSRAKSRLDVSINQRLGDNINNFGTMFFNGSYIDYWNRAGNTKSIQAGYGNRIWLVDYNVSFGRDQYHYENGKGTTENRVMLTLSMPLGKNPNAPRVNYYRSKTKGQGSNNMVGLSGNVPDSTDMFWDIQLGKSTNGEKTGSGNLTWNGSAGTLSGGYDQGHNYKAVNVASSGSVVFHAGGVNVGRQVGETFGLVEVAGTSDVPISGNDIKTGWNGYAIVPALQPFRVNNVGVDGSQNLDSSLDLENPMQQVVPGRGAITKVHIVSQKGRRVQLQLQYADGNNIPFGSKIYDEKQQLLGIVDPFGQSLVLLVSDYGSLHIEAGKDMYQVGYQLGKEQPGNNFEILRLIVK